MNGRHGTPFHLNSRVTDCALSGGTSLTVLLSLTTQLASPPIAICLITSTGRRIKTLKTLCFARQRHLRTLVTLRVYPLSSRCPVRTKSTPILLSRSNCNVCSRKLGSRVHHTTVSRNLPIRLTVVDNFNDSTSVTVGFNRITHTTYLNFPARGARNCRVTRLNTVTRYASVLRQCYGSL